MMKEISPVSRFWLLIKPDRREIQNIYFYAFFNGLVNLSLPVGIQAIINLIQGGKISTSWVVLVSFVILGIIFSGILQINQLKITEHLQQKIFTRAAFEFAYRIPRVKLEALYRKYAPELMNRFFDVVSVQKGLSKVLIDFSTASVQTFFGLLLLSIYHPFFIVYSLVLVILVYTIFKLTSKKGMSTSLTESKHKYTVVHWLEELARTSTSFKFTGKGNLAMEKVDLHTADYIESRESHFKILKYQYTLMVAFKVLVAAGLLVVGSLLVMDQQMNIGQFVAAEIIILLVMGSVEKLIMSLETIYDVFASLEKIGQVTDLELESTEGIELGDVKEKNGLAIEVKDLNFSYPHQQSLVFDKLNMSINEGESILIYGNSSSGKSSFLFLLGGLYEPTKGQISIDGLPLRNYNPRLLRTEIGACLMNETIFEGSLLENITMGRKNISLQDVKKVFTMLELNDFLKSLPMGLDSKLYPEGKEFSRGVIDKLILARTLVDNPKLLLIKDSFSSISKEEKIQIFKRILAKENKWTVIIASQDDDLKNYTDRTFESGDKTLNEIK